MATRDERTGEWISDWLKPSKEHALSGLKSNSATVREQAVTTCGTDLWPESKADILRLAAQDSSMAVRARAIRVVVDKLHQSIAEGQPDLDLNAALERACLDRESQVRSVVASMLGGTATSASDKVRWSVLPLDWSLPILLTLLSDVSGDVSVVARASLLGHVSGGRTVELQADEARVARYAEGPGTGWTRENLNYLKTSGLPALTTIEPVYTMMEAVMARRAAMREASLTADSNETLRATKVPKL